MFSRALVSCPAGQIEDSDASGPAQTDGLKEAAIQRSARDKLSQKTGFHNASQMCDHLGAMQRKKQANTLRTLPVQILLNILLLFSWFPAMGLCYSDNQKQNKTIREPCPGTSSPLWQASACPRRVTRSTHLHR